MLTIRSLVLAALGAAFVSCLTLFGASAQECDDRYPWTCNVATNAAPAAPAREVARMTRQLKAQTRKRKKVQAAKQRREERQDDPILTGSDTVSLVAQLPWWRVDELQFAQAKMDQIASPVLTVADDIVPGPSYIVHTELVDGVSIAAADELNEIDLAASAVRIAAAHEVNEIDLTAPTGREPANQSWLHYIIATLGGALAAASTARFLFA